MASIAFTNPLFSDEDKARDQNRAAASFKTGTTARITAVFPAAASVLVTTNGRAAVFALVVRSALAADD